jgi:hypothetical protein
VENVGEEHARTQDAPEAGFARGTQSDGQVEGEDELHDGELVDEDADGEEGVLGCEEVEIHSAVFW